MKKWSEYWNVGVMIPEQRLCPTDNASIVILMSFRATGLATRSAEGVCNRAE